MKLVGTALAVCVLFGAAGAAPQANAAQMDGEGSRQGGRPGAEIAAASKAGPTRAVAAQDGQTGRAATAFLQTRAGGISCVPYARMVTGMAVRGNGWQWWGNAAGSYLRGQRPEPGAVLAFRASARMTHGHVAVVSRVVGTRHLLIDHANWAPPGARKGLVTRNVSVVDVSEANDWTAVRVQVGNDPGTFGSVYATYGFIYNRPTTETLYAAGAPPERRSLRFEQLAEMPDPRLERFGISTPPSRR